MNDLKHLRKKVADIITESENTPIMAENVMDFRSPKEIIEKKIDECDLYAWLEAHSGLSHSFATHS